MKTFFYHSKAIILWILLLNVICINSFATTLHLKPGPNEGKDAYLSSDAPNTVYADHLEFSGNAWTCSSIACFGRGVLQFDLSSIPAGSIILNATVSFYANPAPQNGGGIAMQGDNESVLQRITTNWDENSVTWNSAPSTTTQNQVILNQSNSPFQDYLNINVKDLVQDMVDDPSNSFGFFLKLTTEDYYTSMIFASSDYSDPNLWPEITIEYADSSQSECVELLLESGLGADAYLSSNSPSTNYGNHEELSGDAWTCNFDPCFGRGLFSFDLSSIPPNSLINSALLDLHANPSPANGNGTAMQGNNSSVIKRVVSDWSENTITWNTAPMTTTQNEVTLAQSTTSFQDYLSIDVKDLVSDMINDPSSSFGFMIKLIDETPYTTMIFASSDYPNASLHPKLTICYSILDDITKNENLMEDVKVFPNPANENLNLKFSLRKSSLVKYDLVDMVGRVIYSIDAGEFSSGNHVIRVESINNKLTKGVYFLRLSVDQNTIIRRIVKS